ncbi:MAG: galactokinase [Clostridiales bacterium]|jgi:galactokinase|nr:galactokinase [Clostridiales bacterium]
MTLNLLRQRLRGPKAGDLLSKLYGSDSQMAEKQITRYIQATVRFCELFPQHINEEFFIFSTPGRTEIGGNHTDHNAGRVLAAGISLDAIAVVTRSQDSVITVYSEGYPEPFIVGLENLHPVPEEEGTTAALIRGIAGRIKESGYEIGGFNAYITSDVLGGSGLSSSACIEILLGTIMNHLYNEGKIDEILLAKIGQYAENVYFNKPCGLMDQIACAMGGLVAIDFKDFDNPIVKKIDFDFASQNYSLLVVNTGGSHADLTDDYAAVPAEMKSVAKALGKTVCREISMADLLRNIPRLRQEVGDRAILRAMHFLGEDQRVVQQVEALEKGDFNKFLKLVNESGNSSWKRLQNCFTTKNPHEQGVTLTLSLTEDFLKGAGKGACRVHGGGFAGTILVFMPNELLKEYVELIEKVHGSDCVTVLTIRSYGTLCINTLI